VRYAAVWKPKPGALSGFPNLAGHLQPRRRCRRVVSDLTLPPVPLVRVAVGDLTSA
jgi:glyoxylate/hydroxypyruvate reductase A